MQILKEPDIDRRERSLISMFYKDQTAGPKADKNFKWLFRVVRQGCSLSRIIFHLHSKYLTYEALKGLDNSK